MAVWFVLLPAPAMAQKQTPPAPSPIQIVSVSPPPAEAALYSPFELKIDLRATFQNPFDPEQISLEAQISPPTGQPYTIPAFYYQEFTASGSPEVLKPEGPPGWRVRIALMERGAHTIVLTAKDSTGTAKSQEITVAATDPASHGFLRVSPRDPRFFEYQDGAPFFPIGSSMFARDLAAFQPWVPRISSAGGNLARIFLAPYGSAFAVSYKEAGPDRIYLANAWRLDQALRLLGQSGLRALVCVDTYNELRERELNPQWTANPFNRDNGGPISAPRLFWTDDAASKLYLQKMRYIFARYGADPTVMGWELWRDVDLTHAFDEAVVRSWFEKHLELLKAMDPYGHLFTTSFSDPLGVRTIDRLPSLDFSQTHLFNVPDLVPAAVLQASKKAGLAKPHLLTEVAADRTSDQSKVDVNGLQVHDPMWASVVSASAGAGMPWWWETAVFPKRTVNRFPALASFVKGIDWPAQKFRPTTPSFAFQSPPTQPFYRDLEMRGPVSWGNTEYNLPRHVRIFPGGVRYGLPVSGILHGQRLHPSKFNPIRFTMDIRRPTTFDMMVTEVSGGGGANVRVTLDGELVLGLEMADPDGLNDTTPITKYNGTYSVPIPAGHHVLVVADVGNDWVKASYRFRDLLSRTTPPLTGFSIVGDTCVLAWIRQADRSWDRLYVQKRPTTASPPTTMTLKGLLPGLWRTDLVDTWAGKVVKTVPITVGQTGEAAVNLPAIETDLAVRMTRVTRPAKAVPKR